MCLTGDRRLKSFSAPSAISKIPQSDRPTLTDAILISDSNDISEGHEKKAGRLVLSASKDWVFTWSVDGNISVRTLMDPENPVMFLAHSPFSGGVYDLVASEDCRMIYSLGSDGLIRVWKWKYTSSGKRNAMEASNAAKSMYEEQATTLSEYSKNLMSYRYSSGQV